MIQVTRLDGKAFCVNAEWIRTVEATPDTVITLGRDEKILVRESVGEVVRRVVAYQREVRLISRLGPGETGERGEGDGER